MAHFGTFSGVDKSTVIAAWKPRIPLAAMSLGSLHPDGEALRLFKNLKGSVSLILSIISSINFVIILIISILVITSLLQWRNSPTTVCFPLMSTAP